MPDRAGEPIRVLFLGASYGSVLGMRIALAGHRVVFACREEEQALINSGRLVLRVPARETGVTLEIRASDCPIPPHACLPDRADPQSFDLVCLAMQEPQYSAAGVRQLVLRIAQARTPCLSLMNMPLPPFLSKFTVLDHQEAQSLFTEPNLWDQFDPAVFTMSSADPQAMQRRSDNSLVVSVTLPSNFKVAPFEVEKHQSTLELLARHIDESCIDKGEQSLHPRVRLRPSSSTFVPLAKWPMLITGNFRCMTSDAPRSIRDAVCGDVGESLQLYEWVTQVCIALGAEKSTLVPFNRYLAAAEGLSLPSSLARGLYAGATAVERVDKLIQLLANRYGLTHPALEAIVAGVSARLKRNRLQ